MEAGVKEARGELESRPYLVAAMVDDVEVRIVVQAVSLADALVNATFAFARKKLFVHYPSTEWIRQNGGPGLMEKMKGVEKSHFVAAFAVPGEYRYMDDYKIYGLYKGKDVSGQWSH